jgi:hypothetical protein
MNYEYPNPYSFGDTVKMDKIIRQEKEDQKKEELNQELKNDGK